MDDQIYPTIKDALEVAAGNMSARKELARRGLNAMIVADVRPVAGGFKLHAVTVETWGVVTKSPTQHIVLESGHMETFRCPVCGPEGTIEREIVVPAIATIPIVEGLDPEHCVGCWDTLVARGRPAVVVRAGDVVESVPRPE